MSESVKSWLVSQLRNFNPGVDISSDVNINMFDAGVLDSFKYIEILDEIQRCFLVNLSFSDLSDKRSQTIFGLAEIVEQKRRDGEGQR